MERTKFKGVNSPLVGLYFIELRLKGNRQEYVRCGKIQAMIKENYWYLIVVYPSREVCNLSDMRNWKFYNSHEMWVKGVREWRK